MNNNIFTIQYAQEGRVQYYNFEACDVKESFWKIVGFMEYLSAEQETEMCEYVGVPVYDYTYLTLDDAKDWFHHLFNLDMTGVTTWGLLLVHLLKYWGATNSRKNRVILRVIQSNAKGADVWVNPYVNQKKALLSQD
jgi:hypothetical protein